jgi:hypothetical protein
MKTQFDSKKRFAAALLGLAALVSGCGDGRTNGGIDANGQPIFPGPGGGVPISGCAPVMNAIPFTGEMRVSPLNQSNSIVYGLTGQNGGPAQMTVGGAPIMSGTPFGTSSTSDGNMVLNVELQYQTTAYTTAVQGSITLSANALSTIRSFLGPSGDLSQACVSRVSFMVTSTQNLHTGRDLVGVPLQLCLRPVNNGGAETCIPQTLYF